MKKVLLPIFISSMVFSIAGWVSAASTDQANINVTIDVEKRVSTSITDGSMDLILDTDGTLNTSTDRIGAVKFTFNEDSHFTIAATAGSALQKFVKFEYAKVAPSSVDDSTPWTLYNQAVLLDYDTDNGLTEYSIHAIPASDVTDWQTIRATNDASGTVTVTIY